MRRAFTLVEMVVVVGVLVLTAAAAAPLFKIALQDVPRARRATQTHSRVCDMLVQMRRDIDAAESLPPAHDGLPADAGRVWIRLPDRTVEYHMEGDSIVRRVHDAPDQDDSPRVIPWHVPNAVIRWTLRPGRTGRDPASVEVTVHVKVAYNGQWLKRLANSHVFFVGAATAEGSQS